MDLVTIQWGPVVYLGGQIQNPTFTNLQTFNFQQGDELTCQLWIPCEFPSYSFAKQLL